MRLTSKKVVIACAIVLAVLIPLSVLGQGWVHTRRSAEAGRGSPAMKARNRGMSGETGIAPVSGFAQGVCPEGTLPPVIGIEDVEELQDRLGLTDDEAEELEALLDDIAGLKDEIKEKMEIIREILAPKLEEKKEQCAEIAEQLKPLYEELTGKLVELREAIKAEDQEAQAAVEEEIDGIRGKIRAVQEELEANQCRPAVGPLRVRIEDAVNRWREVGENIRNRIREKIKECPCEPVLSDEDQEALANLKSEMKGLHEELKEALANADREKIAEIKDSIADVMEQMRELLADNGFGRCFRR